MKKLLIILTGAALLAGCHSRDASSGGTYDESQRMTGITGKSSTGATETNNTTQGTGGAALSNDPANKDKDSTNPNSEPNQSDNQQSQPDSSK